MSLILQNVFKSYGSLKALKGLSVELKKGEVVGLLGPNGAGKSSLMKILTGYYKEWEGQISYDGLDLKKNLQSIQKQVGYLPENNPLYNEMYVIEYLKYVGSLYKLKNPPYEEILKKTGILDYRHHKIQTLSKGYRQRVGLAAALVNNPQLLILDEPTTGLDPNQLVSIRKLIRELGRDKTVLLSTHILQEVDALCDRVIIINKGEIVFDRALAELRNKQEQIIEVSFDYRIEIIALEKILNVQKVVNTHDFDYELTISGNQDMRPSVFDFAHDNGLKILNLQLKNESLEQLFKKLTV
jgi:ABC-2 type transport system ATP-binding protein|tara:strand:+ start:1081 stop:1974 length:894 start_codon:yes stop_codon:yes gene_type:complete